MTEYIFITCGGSGHRLQETMPYPKAMVELPCGNTVLGRLTSILIFKFTVVFCTGYKTELIKKHFYGGTYLATYDVDNPTNILNCFKKVMNFYEQDTYTFILGDTIWHPKALEQALSQRLNKPIMTYRARNNPVCEYYMITFSGEGIDMFKEVYALGKLPKALNTDKGADVAIDQCKILHLAKYLAGNPHTCKKNIGGDPRFGGFANQFPVTDFDTQEQLDKVIKDYKDGVYDDEL